MIKSIYLNNEEKPVEIDTSMGWFLVYRETFGRDILPDILPIIEAASLAAIDILDEADGKTPSVKTIIEAFRNGALIDALAVASSLEITTLLQIVWAMQKNADRMTPGFNEWAKGIEYFPVDELAPVLFFSMVDSMVSLKNARRLKKRIEEARSGKAEEAAKNTSTSIKSSSEQ